MTVESVGMTTISPLFERLTMMDSRLRGNDGGECGNDGGECGNDGGECGNDGGERGNDSQGLCISMLMRKPCCLNPARLYPQASFSGSRQGPASGFALRQPRYVWSSVNRPVQSLVRPRIKVVSGNNPLCLPKLRWPLQL